MIPLDCENCGAAVPVDKILREAASIAGKRSHTHTGRPPILSPCPKCGLLVSARQLRKKCPHN